MTSFRIIKDDIRRLLCGQDPEAAIYAVSQYPPRKVINVLISFYCDPDPLVRWRSIGATGRIVSAHADADMESARVIMRRLMWMLNDESGGIGWGVPEAIGAILALNPRLAGEYGSILISYAASACNFLEHPVLQRGVLWGIGTLARSRPEMIREIIPNLQYFMESFDPWHRGYAARIAGYAGGREMIPLIEPLAGDPAVIDFYEDGWLRSTTVGQLARSAIDEIIRSGKES